MSSRLPLQSFLFYMIIVGFLSGCATTYAPTPLPLTHPANAAALEAPLPPPSQVFHSQPASLSSAAYAPAQHSHVEQGVMAGMHGGH